MAGLVFFLLPLFLIFLLMASPRGLIGILQNGNPFLPLMATCECRRMDEREQKATPFLTALGVAGGTELMGGWRHQEGMCSGVTEWVFPSPHRGAAGKNRSAGQTPEL